MKNTHGIFLKVLVFLSSDTLKFNSIFMQVKIYILVCKLSKSCIYINKCLIKLFIDI